MHMRAIVTAFCLLSLAGVCSIITPSDAQEKLATQENPATQERLATQEGPASRPFTGMACMRADRTCTKDSECCSEVCFKPGGETTAKCWPKVVLW
jgi:hypothetical protein